MNAKRIFQAAVAIVGVFAVIYFSNPTHGSESRIRKWLLKKAPLGSSVHDVKNLMIVQGWKTNYYDWTGIPTKDSENNYPGVRGGHIVGTVVGEYRIIFVTSVDAYWGFDDNGKLIDLRVRKNTDAP